MTKFQPVNIHDITNVTGVCEYGSKSRTELAVPLADLAAYLEENPVYTRPPAQPQAISEIDAFIAEIQQDIKDGELQTADMYLQGLRIYLSAQESTSQAPEGYALAPIEPTDQQLYAAEDHIAKYCTSSRQSRHHAIASLVYKAMLNQATEESDK